MRVFTNNDVPRYAFTVPPFLGVRCIDFDMLQVAAHNGRTTVFRGPWEKPRQPRLAPSSWVPLFLDALSSRSKGVQHFLLWGRIRSDSALLSERKLGEQHDLCDEINVINSI